MILIPPKKDLIDAIMYVMSKSNSPMKTSEIDKKVADFLNLSEEQLSLESCNCSGSEFSYRMRWARTELKQKHKIANPSRGVWEIVEENIC